MENMLPEMLEGSVVDASVTAVSDDQVTVQFGETNEAIIPVTDFGQSRSHQPNIDIGDQLRVYIDYRSEASGPFVASRDKAMRMEALDRVRQIFQSEEVLEGEVVAAVEGGFRVDIGVQAFLPTSQFGLRPIRNPDEVLGQTFTFKIIRFNEARHNIVLSRRVLLEAERDATLQDIKVGSVIEGTVKSLTDYGAFVDIGGIDGLLHNNDISWGRVKHPSEVLTVGDPVSAKVLRFDKKKKKLSLGLRQIQDDPWLTIGERIQLGAEVQGPVISKTDYGVFIEVEPGVEGLVHSTGPLVPETTKEVLKKVEIGQTLQAKVVDFDLPKRRMSLGLVEDD